jgi:SAM-dependent methyltransferase
MTGTADYLAAIDQVPGWFFPPDTLLFVAIDGLQRERGVTGDVLEIGTFQGRCAILLGCLAGPDERLVVCDLFEEMGDISAENKQERLAYSAQHDLPFPQRSEFEAHYLRFHPSLPQIHQIPSADLDRHLTAGTFRFVHVDGGHALDVVRRDIETARRLLGKGGVVVFDDWANSQEPGIALAIWQEYSRGELVPLCFTPGKFYATWDPDGITADSVSAWAARQPDVEVTYPHRLDGHAASYVSMSMAYWQRLNSRG